MAYNTPSRGLEGLSREREAAPAAGQQKRELGAAEVAQFLAEPKYGFMVLEGEQNNPDFWQGVADGLDRQGELRNRVENAADALRRGERVDVRQLTAEINRFFQQ